MIHFILKQIKFLSCKFFYFFYFFPPASWSSIFSVHCIEMVSIKSCLLYVLYPSSMNTRQIKNCLSEASGFGKCKRHFRQGFVVCQCVCLVRAASVKQTDLQLIIRWTEIQREEQRPRYKLNSHCYWLHTYVH